MKATNLLAVLAASGGMIFAATTLAEPAPGKKVEKQAEKQADKKSDKATTLAAGAEAPAFTLTDTDGKTHNLADYKGKVVVLEWFNPECPFIVKHHKTNLTFNQLHEQFSSKDVVFLAINSSAAGKQGNGLELNKKMKEEYKMPFPILIDENGEIGRAYGAKTTPHCFIIDKEGKVVYNGAIDNNKSPEKAGDKNFVKIALEEVLAGKPVTTAQTAPYGCSVKYAN